MSYTHSTHSDKYTGEKVRLLVFDWLSDASGDSTDTTAETHEIVGYIARVVSVPDSGGTQPNDNYGFVLNDAQGIDVLSASGANRDETNVEDIEPHPAILVVGTLSLVVSAAGSANGGKVYVYIV